MPEIWGTHTWTLRVVSFNSDKATVYARKHQFDVGIPVSFDPEYDRITSLEHVLGGFASDLIHCLRDEAKKNRIAVHTIEATMQASLNNPLCYLRVVGAEGHSGLACIQMKTYVSTPSDEVAIRALWPNVLERSPLVRTFQNSVQLNLHVEVIL